MLEIIAFSGIKNSEFFEISKALIIPPYLYFKLGKILYILSPHQSDVASDDDGTVDEPCEEEEEEEEEYSDVSDVGSGEEDELHEEYTPVILKSLPANQVQQMLQVLIELFNCNTK